MGSPLYQLAAEHVAGVVALALAAIAGAYVLGRGRLAHLAPIDVLLVALVTASAAIHAGLALGHGGGVRFLFALDAALLAIVARRVLRGRSAGRLGALALAGSIGAYWLAALGGEPPDQLGLATKLVEIAALAIVLRPAAGRRIRSVLGTVAVTFLVLATASTAWIGSFRAAAHSHDAAATAAHGHAEGAVPPGTLLPHVADREPTAAERAATERFLAATRSALARYADPRVAAEDGYRVAGLAGLDFHAGNPGYERDGRTLDPARPESLVYAVAADGRPVLMGAVFQMPAIHQSGPAIGGPLTQWHAHEHICISVTPPALAGILSPFGMCPLGSIDVPLTAEMIHVWIVPGAPQPFGDLDDEWKRAYLQARLTGP